ncbi:MAG: D-alanine aminotransferase [Planctomycetes bacterium ADurb.Bin412]|nr:MAG: D-alanine aminotransferase [Planctomycetes bacterium ADurb.Bin412]
MELAMINDTVVDMDQAKVSAHDRGLLFGDGVYEVIRFCNGKLFEMEAHMSRFEHSLREMDMLSQVDLAVIRNRVDRALDQSKLRDAKIYFHVTRGSSPRAHDYNNSWQPEFLLTVRAVKDHHHQETGRAIIHPDWRWKRCDIKSLNLLANVLAKHAATKAGAYEAILVDEKGMITEATSSSVLMVKDGALWSAPLQANILPGITRSLLLKWAEDLGLEPQEESFSLVDLKNAEELMITGTGTEVMGITQLDGQTIGNGKLGNYTKQFQKKLVAAMQF